MPDTQTLAGMVRAKFPGVYDDLSDQELESKVAAKYPGAYDDLPRTTSATPNYQGSNARDEAGNPVVDFASGVWQNVNPFSAIRTLGKAMIPETIARSIGASETEAGTYGPGNFAKGVLAAQNKVKTEADAAWKRGDHVTAVRKYFDWLLPIVGPALDQAADNSASGHVARGAGQAVGLGLALGGAKGISEARAASAVPEAASGLTPIEAASNAFADERGIPLDAATRTGSRFLRGVQKVTGESLAGSVPAERAQAAQTSRLTQVGRDLADQTGVTTPRAAEQAGAAANTGIERVITRLHADATQAYDTLREIEAKATPQTVPNGPPRTVDTGVLDASGQPITRTVTPTQQVRLAVDVGAAKSALKPLYDRLTREAELTPLMGGKGRALVALDRLMTGPDVAPLSVVDGALGDLKAMARGAELPELRTEGQGAAALAVQQLDKQVRATAAKAGPTALNALEEGRAKTTAKYEAADVLERLRDEPAQTFTQLTAKGDSQVGLLRRVSREAPDVVQDVARGTIDRLLDRATARGRFESTDWMYSEWQKLGPETKKILFPDAAHRAALDHFFLLSKRIGENPNPSGTALTAAKGVELAALFSAPLTAGAASTASGAISLLLHSPSGARLVTRFMQRVQAIGAKVPPSARTGIIRAAWADVLTAARGAGVPLATPGAAQSDRGPAQ